MPDQDLPHTIILHPVDALLCIRRVIPLRSNKPIALQSPASHEDEDAESRVAEAESFRQRLAVHANKRVNKLDVTVVYFRKLLRKLLVAASQLLKGLGCAHAKAAAELVIPGHASFAVTKDIDSAQVAVLAVRSVEIHEELWVVIVSDCAGVVDAEGIKGVCEADTCIEWVLGLGEDRVYDRGSRFVCAILDVEECDVV